MQPDRSDNIGESLKERGRLRRKKLAELSAPTLTRARNDLRPRLELIEHNPNSLVIPRRNVRALDDAQILRVIHSINVAGFVDPVLIDHTRNVIDGAIRVIAAIRLNLPTVPCIVTSHLTALETRALRLALNRLGEKGKWSVSELKEELIELIDSGIEIEDTGFTISEVDQITFDDEIEHAERGPLVPGAGARAVARPGDVFIFDNRHRLVCGDATDPASYNALMQGASARLVPTDEPYNVPVSGHVTSGGHREFPMASGEMTPDQFLTFNHAWMSAVLPHLCDGGMVGTFIDWRGYPTVHEAATRLNLNPVNLIVWNKTNGGLGSLYRSQYELFALYKKGEAAHVNNIQLGKNGRWRSNVWTYPGASSLGSDSRKGLQHHPTVKPEAMCADMLLDLTNRGEIVLDPFLGSGSTLIAAQRTGRVCYGIELDALYVDLVVKRYEAVFGKTAVLESTGESLDTVGRRRLETAEEF